MIDIIIGAFIGALAGALFVNRQCTKQSIKTDDRLAATEELLAMVEKGLQASLIQQAEISHLMLKQKHDNRIRKTRRSNK